MKSSIKSVSSVFLALLLTLSMLAGLGNPVNADTYEPSRVINIVYDDSTSMYNTDGVEVDTWCQAKYAMEVFVSMMSEKDTINIYYMSDYYQTKATPKARVTLRGKDGVASNVSKIHNAKTKARGTPFDSVKKAYKDLTGAKADKKWLVVLTDGNFDSPTTKGEVMPKSDVDAFFAAKSDDINVCFLGIGAKASVINEDQSKKIFSYQAVTNNDVLRNLTSISSRIFERNKLNVDTSNGTISFDVSMQELIVFAQGGNVNINGIKSSDGKMIQSSDAPVTVSYSECDAEGRNNKPTTDLVGKIATFKTDFAAGSYTVSVSGAATLEVYYKPILDLTVSLVDSNGNPVNVSEKIKSGDYKLVINLKDPITNTTVNSSSKLLGNVDLSARVTNNDVTNDQIYKDGDTVHLDEGTVQLDASARYLDYNYLNSNNSFSIVRDKAISFDVVENPTYKVISEGFESNDYVIVHAKVDGREFTSEEWEKLNTPNVQIDKNANLLGSVGSLGEPVIEKTDEIGTFKIRPVFSGEKPSSGTYQNTDFTISCSQEFGDETWSGSEKKTFSITDTRPWWERNWGLFIRLIILAIILFILAGYLPCFKRYLPKALKSRPYVKSSATKPGKKPIALSGETKKNFMSTIVPYVPQTGTIRYVPRGYSAPLLNVRAAGQNQMLVTNWKQFCGKKEYKFEGQTLSKDRKEPLYISGSEIIESRLKGVKLTCILNQT